MHKKILLTNSLQQIHPTFKLYPKFLQIKPISGIKD